MIADSVTVRVGDEDIRHALERGVRNDRSRTSTDRVLFPEILHGVLRRIASYQARQPLLRFSYSVKTNPSAWVLREAKRAGLLAEVISPQEYEHARTCGFSDSEIVYNGPFPAHYCAGAPAYVFADSIEAYRSAARRFSRSLIGIRLRPPNVPSRFGVPPEELEELAGAVRDADRRDLGVSFHVRPEDYGTYDFRTLTSAVVECARRVERHGGTRIVLFDVGGGKSPQQFDDAIREGDFAWLQQCVADRLPQVGAIFAEPGQALVTPCEAVIAPILELRRNAGAITEVVVGAGYPDLSQIRSFPHRMFWLAGTGVRPVEPGHGRILGRTCLEYDVLSTFADLRARSEGDALAVADAGAYDASMAFDFARGARCA